MSLKLSAQDKDYLRNLPEGDLIIAAEEESIKFHFDYQTVLYWTEGVVLIIALLYLDILVAYVLSRHPYQTLLLLFLFSVRFSSIVTHFTGCCGAKLQSKILLLISVFFGSLEVALDIASIMIRIMQPEPENQLGFFQIVFILQGILIDMLLLILKCIYIQRLRTSKQQQKQSNSHSTSTSTSKETRRL